MTTVEEISEMWSVDGEIDMTNLSREGARIPFLHNKYYTKYTNEWLKLQKYKADFKQLSSLKDDYYRGILDQDELKVRGWKPYPKAVRVSEIPKLIECDEDIINSGLKIGYQQAVTQFLEDICKQITNRNYQLKLILDSDKFKNGQ